LADPVFGLLHLPRFIAKIRYTAQHGSLPKSYRKNYKRGFDRFLCLHLQVEPDQVEATVLTAATDNEALEALKEIFPEEVRAWVWNREVVQKGQTEAGREFLLESLTNMGCPERITDIKSVADMIDFDEGRIL
jgi:hypothetical protein